MDNDTHISVPNNVRNPDDGMSGDEPMSPSQASQLKMLAAEAGLPVDLEMNKREAAKKINELQSRAGRGGSKDS